MLPNSLERKFLLHKCIFEKNSAQNKFLDLKRDSKKFKRSWLSECDKKFSLSLHMKTFREEERKKKVCVWVSEWERASLCARMRERVCVCVWEKTFKHLSPISIPTSKYNFYFNLNSDKMLRKKKRRNLFLLHFFPSLLFLQLFSTKPFLSLLLETNIVKKSFFAISFFNFFASTRFGQGA